MCHTVKHRNTPSSLFLLLLFEEVVGTIAICLQMTFEVFEYLLWSFSSSTHLIVKEHQPFYAVMIYPIETSVRFSFLVLVQHFDGCLVCMQVITLYYLLSKCLMQGLYKPAAIMYPISKRRIRDIHTLSGKALLLAVQGQMIYILVYNGLCQQSCACNGFRQWSFCYRSYQYSFVILAYILRAYIA